MPVYPLGSDEECAPGLFSRSEDFFILDKNREPGARPGAGYQRTEISLVSFLSFLCLWNQHHAGKWWEGTVSFVPRARASRQKSNVPTIIIMKPPSHVLAPVVLLGRQSFLLQRVCAAKTFIHSFIRLFIHSTYLYWMATRNRYCASWESLNVSHKSMYFSGTLAEHKYCWCHLCPLTFI